ncbi:hypothetical protein, partial [Bacillus thuringiensis]|uniref:hypothetical protein n=1 Tax=Bacillus thuringiensis TaxID=1428 RepID=UPI002E175DDA|nr:hypothetical protein [Bacillus thuringiensis]
KNHDVSCGCGCQQDTYNYEQKQEEYNKEYIANEQMTSHYNQEAMYPVVNESMQEDTTYENKQYSESYTCNPTPFSTPNLPTESTRFQKIASPNGSDPWHNRVFDSSFIRQGTQLNNWPFPNHCRTARVDWNLILTTRNLNNDNQDFIFYQTDSGAFIIAGRGHGRVLDISENNLAVITTEYNFSNTQMFRKIMVNANDFRLSPLSNPNIAVDQCSNRTDQDNLSSFTNIADTPTYRFFNPRLINIPTLAPPTQLGPLPALRYLQDSGLAPHE